MNAPRQAGYPIAVEEMIELAAEADRSDHYTVERGDGLLLYASSHLSMARAVFAVWKERQPHGRYLLRHDVEVLERWPPDRD
jgi:hypothetical protein